MPVEVSLSQNHPVTVHDKILLTLGACVRVTVVVLSVCVCVPVTELAASYLIYTLKVR